MQLDKAHALFYAILLSIGSLLGAGFLVSAQSVNVVTSGCDTNPRVIHVAYQGSGDYSSPDVDETMNCPEGNE